MICRRQKEDTLPILVYSCPECGCETEVLLRRGDDPSMLRCSHCGGSALRREGRSSLDFGQTELGGLDDEHSSGFPSSCSGCPGCGPGDPGSLEGKPRGR